jgi:hypothetical protein
VIMMGKVGIAEMANSPVAKFPIPPELEKAIRARTKHLPERASIAIRLRYAAAVFAGMPEPDNYIRLPHGNPHGSRA